METQACLGGGVAFYSSVPTASLRLGPGWGQARHRGASYTCFLQQGPVGCWEERAVGQGSGLAGELGKLPAALRLSFPIICEIKGWDSTSGFQISRGFVSSSIVQWSRFSGRRTGRDESPPWSPPRPALRAPWGAGSTVGPPWTGCCGAALPLWRHVIRLLGSSGQALCGALVPAGRRPASLAPPLSALHPPCGTPSVSLSAPPFPAPQCPRTCCPSSHIALCRALHRHLVWPWLTLLVPPASAQASAPPESFPEVHSLPPGAHRPRHLTQHSALGLVTGRLSCTPQELPEG